MQSSECSLQSSNVCFEVPSEYLRWLNSEQFDWLTYYGSQSELAQLAHRKLSERTSKQTLELCNEHSEFCNEHSELTNEHSKWFFKSELKSRVILQYFTSTLLFNLSNVIITKFKVVLSWKYYPSYFDVNQTSSQCPYTWTFFLVKQLVIRRKSWWLDGRHNKRRQKQQTSCGICIMFDHSENCGKVSWLPRIFSLS